MKNGLSLKKLVIIAVVVVYNKFNKRKLHLFWRERLSRDACID